MDRGTFLCGMMAGIAVSASHSTTKSLANECSPGLIQGIQLFSVRDLLGADARAALLAVGDLGFRHVEFFDLDSQAAQEDNFFGLSPRELTDTLRTSGLSMKHSYIGNIWEDTDTVARIAEKLGIEVLILGAAEEFYELPNGVFNPKPATDIAQLDRLAERLNKAGARYHQLGFTFGYHNHWTEFIPVANNIPLDYLIENTDPNYFKLELDLAWLAVAGIDPVTYIQRHSNRVISCHLKDFDNHVVLPEKPTMAQYIESAIFEPGLGAMDFEPILIELSEIGLSHAFIEVDKSSDPLAAIERGMQHLGSLEVC